MNTERAHVGWGFWLWWVLASTVGWVVGLVVGGSVNLVVEGFMVVELVVAVGLVGIGAITGWAVGGAVYGAITGGALVWLLRQPIPKEEA